MLKDLVQSRTPLDMIQAGEINPVDAIIMGSVQNETGF